MGSSAKFVIVVAKIGNVSVPINSITLRHAINTLPSVEFTTQLANGANDDVAMDLETFQKLNKLTQEKFYNSFSITPDVVIAVTDGDGNTLNFSGLLMRPTQRIVNGRLNIVFCAIHIGATLQAFNGSIYDVIPFYTFSSFQNFFNTDGGTALDYTLISQIEQLPPINASTADWSSFMGKNAELFDTGSVPKTNSIAQRIFGIVNGLHDNVKAYYANAAAPLQAALNVSVLNANSAVLPYIKNLMMGSLKTTLIEGIVPSPPFPDDALHDTIFKIFAGESNFLTSLLEYLNPFLMQLNAGWAGQLAIEPNQFVEPPGQRVIQAPIEDVTFSLASDRELPIAQVIVEGQPEDYYIHGGNFGTDQIPTDIFAENLEQISADVSPQNSNVADLFGVTNDFDTFTLYGNTLRILAKYPPTPNIPAGRFVTVKAPAWTDPISYTGIDLYNTDPDSNRFVGTQVIYGNKIQDFISKSAARIKILNYIAQTTFKSLYLARTNAFITIPLNVKVQVGRTYTVKSMEGADLYVGYLSSVSHTIVLEGDGGSASTSLDFSHVQVANANLSGLNITITRSNLNSASSFLGLPTNPNL